MKSELNDILTVASAAVSTLAALVYCWLALNVAKRDRSLSKAYKVDVEKLMIELRRDYAKRLKLRKGENLSPQS